MPDAYILIIMCRNFVQQLLNYFIRNIIIQVMQNNIDKIQLYQDFMRFQDDRKNLNVKGKIQAILDYSEYFIRMEFDKSSVKNLQNKKKKAEVNLEQQYIEAFLSQTIVQKIQQYIRTIKFIKDIRDGIFDNTKTNRNNLTTTQGYSRSYNLKIWKKKKMRLDRQKNIILCEKQDNIKIYELKNYLIRQSKNKQFNCFVLEAINKEPYVKLRTVHLGFKDLELYKTWYDAVRDGVIQMERKRILREIGHLYGLPSLQKRVLESTKSQIFYGKAQQLKINEQQQRFDQQVFQKAQTMRFLVNPITNKQQQNQKQQNVMTKTTSFTQKYQNSKRQEQKNVSNDKKQLKKTIKQDNKKIQKTINQENKKIQKNMKQEIKKTQKTIKQENKNTQKIKKQDHKKIQKTIKQQNKNIQKTIKQQTKKILKKQQTNVVMPIVVDLIDKQQLFNNELQLIDKIQEVETKEDQTKLKKNLNLFIHILPQYNLETLPHIIDHELIQQEQNIKLYRNKNNLNKYKFFLRIENSSQSKIFQTLANIDSYTKWNTSIEEISIKNLIRSENTAIIYQKLKAYNKLYRPRDFLFLRHTFKKNQKLYIIDKSIQNSNYPPFLTIIRGSLVFVWEISNQTSGFIKITVDIEMKNQGYLNPTQQNNLIMNYLKGLFYLNNYLINQRIKSDEVEFKIFDQDWDISKNSQNKQVEQQIKKKRITTIQTKLLNENNNNKNINELEKKEFNQIVQTGFKKKLHKKISDVQVVQYNRIQTNEKNQKIEIKLSGSQKKNNSDDKGQIQPNQLVNKQIFCGIQYKFDQNGRVIIPNQYLRHRYQLHPSSPLPIIYQQVINGNAIWKGEWKFDTVFGGIIFTNQKKIQQQKGVLKYILSKIGKNLISGKSVLNISLPVDIFTGQSNLQRLSIGMTFGPIFLQKAVQQKNYIQKLKWCISFGITNSILYLNMQKPFNPILGETFQGWINGCPVYMQQISHHPPIAAFLYLGRGYKISGSLQSKVEVHLNSGCGTTDGVYKIQFEDGGDICFITPGGQISGLAYGDRKFNLINKSYYWSKKHNLFLELVFNPNKKGFFSTGKQQTPSDYFQGTILQVKKQFLQKFVSKSKKEGPTVKQIISEKGRVLGIWNKQLIIDGKKYLDTDVDIPCKLQYEKHLLPSDGNWREDIAYRRLLNVNKAQNEKQRLQILQRNDRKLRQKYQKLNH